jgi:hypothetical protein
MKRRTFLAGLAVGSVAPLAPLTVGAKPHRHANYHVQYFDRITKLVPHYGAQSRYSASELRRIAKGIIAQYPKPQTKRETMLQRRDQVPRLWHAAFGSEPTPYQTAYTVHYLSHYDAPQVTLHRSISEAFAQDVPAINFSQSVVDQGLANLTVGLTIAISVEAAAVAFEGVALSTEAMAGILGQMAATQGAVNIAALGIGFAAVGLTALALAAIGIGLITLAVSMTNDDGSAGNVTSCTTCDCTSSSACGVGPDEGGPSGGDSSSGPSGDGPAGDGGGGPGGDGE